MIDLGKAALHAALKATEAERDRLRARAEAAERLLETVENNARSQAMLLAETGCRAEAAETALECVTIPTARFLDPPDGGDVPVSDQVSRMYAALLKAEMERDYLRERERHFAEVLGVADGGQYRNDWDARIQKVVADRNEAIARVEAAEAKLAEADSLVLLTTMRAVAAETSLAALKVENERLRLEMRGLIAAIHAWAWPVEGDRVSKDHPLCIAASTARTALETTNG